MAPAAQPLDGMRLMEIESPLYDGHVDAWRAMYDTSKRDGFYVAHRGDLLHVVALLRWTLYLIAEGCDGLGSDGTPLHVCEFSTNPEKGACDFHEKWWDAVEVAGLMEQFCAEAEGDAPEKDHSPEATP